MRLLLFLTLCFVLPSQAKAQLEVFWDSTEQIDSEEVFSGTRATNLPGGTGFETLGSNSNFYDQNRIIRRVTIPVRVVGDANTLFTWRSEFDPATIVDYETTAHALSGLGQYDLLIDEQEVAMTIVPLNGDRYHLIYENLDRQLDPFEDWHSIFSQRGDLSTIAFYHTASVEGANPFGGQGSINFFGGALQFLSEISALNNQAIAWKVEGEIIGVLLGDVNQDGSVDLLDVSPFVDLLTIGGFLAEADINQDGVVNLLDVQPFVDLFTAG